MSEVPLCSVLYPCTCRRLRGTRGAARALIREHSHDKNTDGPAVGGSKFPAAASKVAGAPVESCRFVSMDASANPTLDTVCNKFCAVGGGLPRSVQSRRLLLCQHHAHLQEYATPQDPTVGLYLGS